MSEHETRDFMSVDSFSQLPFIRPSSKPSSSPIRLFGYDFPQNSSTKETSENNTAALASAAANDQERENITGRKFECHYCCRKFPTSQALGGHQNAHKRERQQAKRAHLQSVMAAAQAHHHHAAGIAEGHVYGVLNNHRLAGSIPIWQHGGANHSHHHHHPSWTTSSGVGAQLYGHLGSLSQPINGNPLPGLCLMHRDNNNNNRSMPSSLFESRPVAALPTARAILLSSSSSPSSSNSQSAKGQNVSLDLRL